MASALAGGRSRIIAIVFPSQPRTIVGSDLEYVLAAWHRSMRANASSPAIASANETRTGGLAQPGVSVRLVQPGTRD
jgi:hypothetical protein